MVSLKNQVAIVNKFLTTTSPRTSTLVSVEEKRAIEFLVEYAEVSIALRAGKNEDIDAVTGKTHSIL